MTAELRAPGGGSGLPPGGTAAQVLTKINGTDGNADWEDPTGGSGVPPGGSTGQPLRKNSNVDGDASFGDLTLAAISDAGTAAAADTGDFDAAGVAAAGDATEATARIAGDGTNAAAISAEAAARASAITSEATSRAAGDATNASAISTETTRATAAEGTNASAITAEATARASADTSEATTRAAADTTNANAISTETSRATAAEALKAPIANAVFTGTVTLPGDPASALQAATKQYVDALISASDAVVYKGVIDCSANPNYPAADAGHLYRISVAGKIGGASGVNVEVGDTVLCLADGTASGNQATVGVFWNIIQANIDGAVVGPASSTDGHLVQFNGSTGKIVKDGIALDTDGTLAANSDTRVATEKATKTYVDAEATARAAADATNAAAITTETSRATAAEALKLAKASNLSDLASASTSRTNLGVAIGTDVEAHDADLTTIAALDSTVAGALVTDGAGWIRKTYAQLKTALGLVKADVGLGSVDNTSDVNKPVSTAQQTALDLKANLASPALTGSPTAPTQATGDASTKLATDAFVATAIANAIAGVNPAVAVQVATAAVLPNSPTYANGVTGIGATLTAGVTNTALVVDGYTPVLNDRVLVKDQASGLQNGVYLVSQVAALGLAWILTRALDYDQPSDINNTGTIPVGNHGTNALTSWLLTSQITAVGTDALTYTLFQHNTADYLLKASNLSDLANAATARTNLGVAIGSQVEAWSTRLDVLAGTTDTGTGAIVRTSSPALVTPTGIVASDIASGTFATARLGSGSATSSTVLLGNQTWGPPPSDPLLQIILRQQFK